MDTFENYKTDLVTKLSWLLGVRGNFFTAENSTFDNDALKEIKQDKDANIVRSLCLLRIDFLRNYNYIFDKQTNFIPLEQMDEQFVHLNAIKYLRQNNIEIVQANRNTTMYIAYINQLILDYVDRIKKHIPTWIKWEYIRNLFLMPDCYSGHKGNLIASKGDQAKVAKKIHYIKNIYTSKLSFFPFSIYLNWPQNRMSDTYGNIFFNDAKFLNIIYSVNNDSINAENYVVDAKADDKNSIYNFIENAKNICIFVDCENVDPYIFISIFKNLNSNNLIKIKKIVLIDDKHTCFAWSKLESVVDIPIEHHEVERLLEHKSLVDINLTAVICKEYYANNVESIILCSSDSDFWGLIKSIPQANFLILNESDKTSCATIEKLELEGIKHCFMDSFAQGEVHEFKEQILKLTLNRKIARFNREGVLESLEPMMLVERIFSESRIRGSEEQLIKEKQNFYNRYLKKGLKLNVVEDKEGKLKFKMEFID